MIKDNKPLDKMDKKNPFEVPEGYFSKIDIQVLEKINQRKQGSPIKQISYQRYAIAAAFIGVLLAIGFIMLSPLRTQLFSSNKQIQADSELTIASNELFNSLKITSVSFEKTEEDQFSNLKNTKAENTLDVTEQEMIDYISGNELDSLIVDM